MDPPSACFAPTAAALRSLRPFESRPCSSHNPCNKNTMRCRKSRYGRRRHVPKNGNDVPFVEQPKNCDDGGARIATHRIDRTIRRPRSCLKASLPYSGKIAARLFSLMPLFFLPILCAAFWQPSPSTSSHVMLHHYLKDHHHFVGSQSQRQRRRFNHDGSSFSSRTGRSRGVRSSFAASFDNMDTSSSSSSSSYSKSSDRSVSTRQEAEALIDEALVFLENNQLPEVYNLVRSTVERLAAEKRQDKNSDETRLALSESVDAIVQAFCAHAFKMPAKRDRVIFAVHALLLQLSSAEHLSAPYRTVPKQTLTHALNALTSLNEVKSKEKRPHYTMGKETQATKLSFRILQRLITGVGVRQAPQGRQDAVTEREINQVLNVFSNTGRMDMAHRIVALQERSRNAPPLSPVAYSILLKGYGRQADLVQVEEVMRHAKKNRIKPDIVLLNTLIDTYINCNEFDEAQKVFDQMRKDPADLPSSKFTPEHALPKPNQRTYNIMLKGLANAGSYEKAVALSDEMGGSMHWDPVTTNTLVRAAVIAQDFDAAESILAEHTIDPSDIQPNRRSHPNIEAYTQMIDGYGKCGRMKEAMAAMQTMSRRGVEPNIITYTCMIAGFGRSQQIDEAQKLIDHMSRKGLSPSTVTYNALMSAVTQISDFETDEAPQYESVVDMNTAVDQCISLFRDMMKRGVRPNRVTGTVLIEAMGRCNPPRVESANLVFEMLEKKKLIPMGDTQVTTALIRVCGFGGEIKRAAEHFRKLETPDLTAINAFLDACYRCDRHDLVLQTFNHYFKKKGDRNVKPDVITYSVLIRSALANGSIRSLREAQSLYVEMKRKWAIRPDQVLIDTLLRAIISGARTKNLAKSDALFAANVLRDADRLTWQKDQLERRKRTIRAILGDRLREVRRNDQRLGSLVSDSEEDELFKRKGWNKVDSGFRLWGQASQTEDSRKTSRKNAAADEFLESHGWNDVDSGFRIL